MSARQQRVAEVLRILSRDTRRGRYASAPVYQGIWVERTPFQTLVACLISTRTRDEQTLRIARDLFEVAPSPEALVELSEARLSRILYGAGFYRQKAKQLRALAGRLIEEGDVLDRARWRGCSRSLVSVLSVPISFSQPVSARPGSRSTHTCTESRIGWAGFGRRRPRRPRPHSRLWCRCVGDGE